MKKNDDLPKEVQIKKLKRDSKIRLVIICIYLPIIISLSIYLIILKEPLELGLGFLLGTPLSVYLGYILPVKENNKKIRELVKNEQNTSKLQNNQKKYTKNT